MEHREIKFRAWSKNGGYFCQPDSWHGHYDDLYLQDIEKILNDDGYVFQQFTGLHDKNGKEIYEGDVVATCWHSESGEQHNCPGTKNPYEVEWTGYEYALSPTNWNRNHNALARALRSLFVGSTPDEKIEVIGNIYENADLLK